MTDGLLPIGAFSRASLISIKALRAYHDSGLLVPAQVDGSTGYRSYTVDQLTDAAIIVRLRGLDVSLDDVRRVLQARDPAVTAEVLSAHRARMEQRLADTERIVAELHATTSDVTHTPVHVRTEQAATALSLRGTIEGDGFAVFLDHAYTTLYASAARLGVRPTGSYGALYEAELADDVEPVEAVLPIAVPVLVGNGDVVLGELPAATCAVLMHVGAYESIGSTYRALGAWVARHAEPSGERVREWYLIGPGDVDDSTQWRTEISWPIHSPTG